MTKHEHETCRHCGAPTAICETCGSVFWVHPQTLGKFCSKECYWHSKKGKRRVATLRGNKQQRMRRLPEHPLAPPSGLLAVARITLWEKIGSGPHKCHWCGETVNWVAGGARGVHARPGYLIADHLDWDRSNDAPENLVPSCNICNAHRRADNARSLIRPGEPTVIRGGRPTRALERRCRRCDALFLTTPAEAARGVGIYCSRACMYARNR